MRKTKSNKLYTVLWMVIFGTLLTILLLCIVKRCDTCSLPSEGFDNSMLVDARRYNKTDVTYKDRVYVVRGSDFTVNDDSIRLHGTVKSLKVDDIVIGEEAPGFMRRITKVIRDKKDTLLTTVKVDIDKVISEANLDKVFTFKDFVITGEDSPKFKVSDDGIKMVEKYDVDRNYQNTFEKVARTSFSNQTIGLNATITGTITFTPTITAKGSIGIRGVNSFNLETRGNASFDLEVPISIYKNVDENMFKRIWPTGKKELLYQWNIPIYTGVWITIKPSIDGNLDLKLSANLAVQNYASLRSTRPFFFRFSYLSDREQSRLNQRVEPFKSGTGKWQTDHSIVVSDYAHTLKCDVKAGLYFDLNFLLWGFTGPYVSLRPYYKIIRDTDFSDLEISQLPTYSMSNGPGLDVYVGGRFFSYNFDRLIYDNWWYESSAGREFEYDLELPEIIID